MQQKRQVEDEGWLKGDDHVEMNVEAREGPKRAGDLG
jgi:hypothetical protein